MKHCCEDKHEELMVLKIKQSKALKFVFFINLGMFLVEFIYGWKAQSTALLADSLDMLGDAFVYGFSLYVLYKSPLMRNRAAQLKGGIMVAFGLGVMGQAIYKIISGSLPAYETMGMIGLLALLANLVCVAILFAHKQDDINMRSTWVCSRNDIIANLCTLLAAFFVGKFHSFWPDVLMGVLIATLFLSSAFSILKESILLPRGHKN